MGKYFRETVVVDIDGTIADHGHRVHLVTGPNKDWDAFYSLVGEDDVHEKIATLVRLLAKTYDIAYVTGRREACREETEKWLEENDLDYHYTLRMRQPGDKGKDYEVKPKMIEDFAKEIFLILEDRTSVVNKWRELGYTCLQVKEGDY